MDLFERFCFDCESYYNQSVAANIPPKDIVAGLKNILKEAQKPATDLGGAATLEIHKNLIPQLDFYVKKAVTYQMPLSDIEKRILQYFSEDGGRCMPKKVLQLKFEPTDHINLSQAVDSLYERGLLEAGQLSISLCLTATGQGYEVELD